MAKIAAYSIHAGLTATDLDHLLWRLCEYGPLRESSGQVVGPSPAGTRATLKYLELGPPGGDGAWDGNLGETWPR